MLGVEILQTMGVDDNVVVTFSSSLLVSLVKFNAQKAKLGLIPEISLTVVAYEQIL